MAFSAKQRKVKATIFGEKDLSETLKNMGEAATGVLADAAKSGGKIALDDAKRRCPVDTGALRDSLKLTEDKATKTKADVKVEYDKSLRYGVFVELGARGREANPFMRNAVDENVDKINETIITEVINAVGRKM